MDLGSIEWGPIATWSGTVVTIVFSVRTWPAERAAKKSAQDAAQQAEHSTAAAEKSAEVQQQIAEVARRAFPEPKDFAFSIEHMQRGQFRIRNTGKRTASDIKFIEPEPIEGIPDAWWPVPQWVNDDPITFEPDRWADFRASAMSPVTGQ